MSCHGWTCRAFTLLELLVAMSLSLLIIGLVALLVGQTSGVWQQSSSRLIVATQANAVLDQIQSDLQCAWGPCASANCLVVQLRTRAADVALWDSIGSATLQKPVGESMRLQGTTIAADRFGVGGCSLSFFTMRKTADAPAGVPVAVGYQLIRRRLTPAMIPRYYFHRAEVRAVANSESAGVLECGYALRAAGNSPYEQSNEEAVSLGVPGSLVRPVNWGNLLLDNVVDFGVRFYTRDPQGERQLVFPIDSGGLDYAAGVAGGGAWPIEAELMIRVLTPEGAERLAELEAPVLRGGPRPAEYGSDAEWWWGVVERYSFVFVRWVEIRAHPL